MSNLCESSVVWLLVVVMIVLSCVFHCTLMLACHFSFYSWLGSLQQWFDRHDSKSDCLDVEFVWVECCLVACCNDCVVMCVSLHSHACLSFFILQMRCISSTIVSRVNLRVLPVPLLMNVPFPVMTTTMIHADPFRETLMHSRGVILYKIVYIIGLKCTIVTLFYFKFELCHIVE
jgi:hypothetical protein